MQGNLDALKTIRLLRYSPPNKLDDVPYGSQCLVRNGQYHDIYVQINPQQGDPKWHYVYCAPKNVSYDDIDKRIKSELKFKF